MWPDLADAGTVAITGVAGGIGRATRDRLEADGYDVIGVDLVDAEIIADLAVPEGRRRMVAQVAEACGGRLDGVVAAAGISGGDGSAVVSLNYFGAVATLAGLRPLLAASHEAVAGEARSGEGAVGGGAVGKPGTGVMAHASALAISSNSTTTQPGVPLELVQACLGGDEDRARSVASRHPGSSYPASKLALAHWIRSQAVAPEWIGSGIRLNAIAPGLISTPMTQDSMDFILGLGDVFPIPAQRAGTASEVAGLVAYLVSAEAGFFCGSVIFMDGGTDAAVRTTDWPARRP